MKPRSSFATGLAIAIAALVGCQSTNMAPIRESTLKLEPDEERLWARSVEEEGALARSGLVADLPELEAYLTGIVDRLHPEPLPGGGRFHVRVLVDPTLNAFAMPNGAIYVHTGMLSRIENEAQIATILAHELSHTTHRHGVRGMRSIKNKTAFLMTFTVGTGGIGGGVLGILGAVGTMASVSGYSQDLEREADMEGFKRLVATGYDPRESPKVFQLLLEEAKRAKFKEPFFFGSHPRLEERIASFNEMARKFPSGEAAGALAAGEYERIVAPALPLNAAAALHAGDFDLALANVHRGQARTPDEPGLGFIAAETYRKRAGDGDAALAVESYARILAQHPGFADAHRGLGLMRMRAGDRAGAADSFRTYVKLSPDASDRAYIEEFIKQCEQES